MLKLKLHTVSLGCDPEFFFTKDGQVVGSEKLLPRDGMEMPVKVGGFYVEGSPYAYLNSTGQAIVPKIIIDGIQAELNPRPNNCRQGLAAEIGWCFGKIKDKLLVDGHS